MMLQYLKESLHWIHLTFLKPITLKEEGGRLSRKEAVTTYLKVFPVGLTIILVLVIALGIFCEFVGIPFNWSVALIGTLAGGLAVGLGGWLGDWQSDELGAGLFGGLGSGLGSGLVFGLGFGLGSKLVFGLLIGLLIGLIAGLLVGLLVGLEKGGTLVFKLLIGLIVGLIVGLLIGLIAGLLAGLLVGLDKGMNEALMVLLGYAITFLPIFLRPFYLLPYAIQYWRAGKAGDPFEVFRNSPVYWDEVIALPLPYLTHWLVSLAKHDRERGLAEISFVAAKRPYQRRAAQKALLTLATQDLQRVDSVEKMAESAKVLKFIPAEADYLPKGLNEVQRRITAISNLAHDYLIRMTPVGQAKVLEELRGEVQSFRDAMVLVKRPVGTTFQPLAARWLEIVKAAEEECRKRLSFTPIQNPFIAGNPLQLRDQDLFKGRKDIIVAIEENIINPNQRPSLLLYGRRRIGKSSTLLNLPRLLSSQFVPVYIDCQNAKWRDSDAMFCYQMVNAIFGELFQRALHDGLSRPREEEFEKHTFTRFDDYLDRIEAISRRAGKQILLTFDEYERMEEGIKAASITREVFNQIRHVVQHRERIVVLFSGSHRFEELPTVNWADYLINVKTLELSFLAPEDARELVTRPVPDFKMQYEPGVAEKILALTHCQPYLLQAVASDLVNYLNSQQRMVATADDLAVAVAKVLVTVQVYFHYIWAEDCSEAEREVLRAIAKDEANNLHPAQPPTAVQSLCHKEILERVGDRYRFTIELFRRWIVQNQIAGASPVSALSDSTDVSSQDLATHPTV